MDISKTMSFTTRGNRCPICGAKLKKEGDTYCDSICLRLSKSTNDKKGSNKLIDEFGYCGVSPIDEESKIPFHIRKRWKERAANDSTRSD